MKSESSSPLSLYTPQGQLIIDQKDFITPEMKGEQRVRLFLRASENNPGSYEVLVITLPVSAAASTLEAFKTFLYVAMPVTLVLAGGLGFLLIWVMLKPVKTMTRAAHEIGETDLSRRIDVRSEDELGQLALTLNQTFERLQKAFESEYQFTADASHELRTPLAIMRGEATLALNKERSNAEYRKSLEVISQETSHMSSIITKLLTLARVDAGKNNLNSGPVRLKELLSELAADVSALCEDKSLHFNLDLQENFSR
jgi:signal transduction histidine kinase